MYVCMYVPAFIVPLCREREGEREREREREGERGREREGERGRERLVAEWSSTVAVDGEVSGGAVCVRVPTYL